ncbi:MAG: 7-carboxy-7-deazaguanine synthase [Candidatus Omnitrophica bacterium]|nr:7-carboxy-7-deazaguanine synthase [Candidatus Omnitrophota bacterium]
MSLWGARPRRLTDRSTSTEISEVFSSLQGEGPYLGVKQIFVRHGRCNMHCGYCDELEKMREERFDIVTLEELCSRIDALEMERGPHHSVSLTGGEPLAYAPFLRNLLPRLKEKGYRTYLETNGTLPRELESVLRWCDIIAMDLKPPTSTGDRAFWQEHRAFLKTGLARELFVKVVVTPETGVEEIARCVDLVADVNPHVPFILQPLTAAGSGPDKAAMALIESELFDIAKSRLSDVRAIAQMHKIWGVR